MAISVSDLPHKYQVQALKKYRGQQTQEGMNHFASPTIAMPNKQKYNNVHAERVTVSGSLIRFDSQKEARHYDQLILCQQSGQIRDLRLQVDFTLQEAYTDTEGQRVRAIRYKADFTYYRQANRNGEISLAASWMDELGTPWILVVEDVKSRATKTKEYMIKRKLMKERLGIEISEV